MGHFSTNCPKKANKPNVKARAFQMTAEEAKEVNDVVTGICFLNYLYP